MTSIDAASDLTRFSGTWTLDPERTTVEFHTKAMWILPVKGRAKALSGEAQINPSGDATGRLVIDATSVDTKNRKRDNHLRTADFFEVDKFPTIEFAATRARPAGAGLVEVTGDLTVHGVVKPLTLQAEVSESGNSATVSSEVEIDRSLWGVTWAKMGTGLKNTVRVSAHFDRTQS
jgi:polyisoprenoid-binding protein YceI